VFYLRIIKDKFKDRIKKKLQLKTAAINSSSNEKKTLITCYDEKNI